MRHDPLCMDNSNVPADLAAADCDCDLIARVREDEAGRKTFVAYQMMKDFRDNGYAAALRDAVEAVKAETTVHPAARQRVVAAIEALVDTPSQQPKEHINPTGYDPAATDNRP